MKSGIYKIINVKNNKIYIGSAVNLEHRKTMHISDLKLNKHCNPHLQNSYNLYGNNVFNFETIEFVERDRLIEIEQYYINALNPEYNICKNAASRLGSKCSDETKRKISLANRGRIMSEEARKKSSKSHRGQISGFKGKMHSIESKNKISKSNKGKVCPMKGKTHSIKSKNKMSKSHKGIPTWNKNKKWDEKAKRKMSMAKNNKRIKRIDVNNNCKYYECLFDATSDGFSARKIINCCKLIIKQHDGYRWEYAG